MSDYGLVVLPSIRSHVARLVRAGCGPEGRRRLVVLTTAAALVVAIFVVAFGPTRSRAGAAPAGPSPVLPRSITAGVTADALPTVQLNEGVAWSSVVVGNAVYVGGAFNYARPAGAAVGQDLSFRHNMLAFDIRTGKLSAAFHPDLNQQVKVVAKSPDGSRVYVGGQFTTVNGQTRTRLAAFSRSTGDLVSTFHPVVNGTVNAIAVSASTVYVGGAFTSSHGTARSHLAAFKASDGSLLAWAPQADSDVNSMILSPDGSRVIVAGSFGNINGSTAQGVAAIGPTNGQLYPYAVNQVVHDYGPNSAILNLSTDGNTVYGTGYDYGSNVGNFEGVFAAVPNTGEIRWLADCHGDSYGAFAMNGAVYSVSHQHFCGNIGGFPDTRPAHHFTTAFTPSVTGTVQTNTQGGDYGNFAGQPSPSLLDWFPNFTAGTYTGQSQAAWTVTGNGTYLVEGGEFPSVNGTKQYGLVRFAISSAAPNKIAPHTGVSNLSASAQSSTSAALSWSTTYDSDDGNLTYSIYRSGTKAAVYSASKVSSEWALSTMQWHDTGLSPGRSYTYTLRISDPSGNVITTTHNVTTPASGGIPTTYLPPAPSTPLIVKASPGAASATLSWSPVPGAETTGYVVRKSSNHGATWYPATISPGGVATRTTVTHLAGRVTYVFDVAARNHGGTSAYSQPSAAVTVRSAPKRAAVAKPAPAAKAPTTHITAPTKATVGQQVSFSGSSTVRDSGAKITDYHWRIGKHTYVKGNPISFTFKAPGTYQVFVAAYDSTGTKSSTATIHITVTR